MAYTLTEDEYLEHDSSDDGFCTECQEFTELGGVEPDARGYECPQCHTGNLYGTEEALMEGYLEIE